MTYDTFLQTLKLEGRVASITRVTVDEDIPRIPEGCVMGAIRRAMQGDTVLLTGDNVACKGSPTGLGIRDEVPPIPGGFGHFVAGGRGKGFPPGERVKRTPELAEAMLANQPQDVMGGHNALLMKPYDPADTPDTVTMLANPDQLATLIHMFAYDSTAYDNVIMPMVSGCASVFRIPLGEAVQRGDDARAVVGNVDVFSRPHLEKDTFFFTVSGKAFAHMLEIAGESVLVAPIFKGVAARL